MTARQIVEEESPKEFFRRLIPLWYGIWDGKRFWDYDGKPIAFKTYDAACAGAWTAMHFNTGLIVKSFRAAVDDVSVFPQRVT